MLAKSFFLIVSCIISTYADGQARAHSSQSKFFADRSGSMRHFLGALRDIDKNVQKRPVRILYFGTSNNGYDRVGSAMRKTLQTRFQDGGKGYVPITRHWKHLRHRDITWTSKGFRSLVVTKEEQAEGQVGGDGRYGLGGVLAISTPSAEVEYKTISGKNSFVPGTRFSHFALYYRDDPSGGVINIEADNKNLATINTKGKEVDKIARFTLRDSGHRLKITTSKDPVYMYGVTFERQGGVVVDSIPYVGAHIEQLKNFDKAHIKRQLMSRRPDLLIFQYGENEAVHKMTNEVLKKFEDDYVEGVETFTRGYPSASCLIVSIKDIGDRRSKTHATRESVPKVVEAARRVALRTNCAFLDLFGRLGGAGTMKKWHAQKPPLVSDDLGHLLDRGAFHVGKVLADVLIEEYQKFP